MADEKSWNIFPPEIRIFILEALIQDSCSLAGMATVSREWQPVIEHHNFARIRLTPSRLADFGPMTTRNRGLVRYLWFCLELEEYDCTLCAPENPDISVLSEAENTMITTAFQGLFSTLSACESSGNLLLGISAYSPSDSQHWFKYLTFESDDPPYGHEPGRWPRQSTPAQLDDRQHGWVSGIQDSAPTENSINKVLEDIMGEGPFAKDEEEYRWWRQLPLIPAVTGMLLRQQTRRRWKPKALANMLSRVPNLNETHYEPWREWDDTLQRWTDECEYCHACV